MKQVPPLKQFDSLKFDDLLALRERVEAAIDSRIVHERGALLASLKRLDEISANGKRAISRQTRNVSWGRRTLAPKYRNPVNPNETWAGRGLRPRWLVVAMKGGKKKLADFRVRE